MTASGDPSASGHRRASSPAGLGQHGLGTTVVEVARFEAALDLDDLAGFTPR
jgi:hypothetical protein